MNFLKNEMGDWGDRFHHQLGNVTVTLHTYIQTEKLTPMRFVYFRVIDARLVESERRHIFPHTHSLTQRIAE